jgi:hypothetical protein
MPATADARPGARPSAASERTFAAYDDHARFFKVYARPTPTPATAAAAAAGRSRAQRRPKTPLKSVQTLLNFRDRSAGYPRVAGTP